MQYQLIRDKFYKIENDLINIEILKHKLNNKEFERLYKLHEEQILKAKMIMNKTEIDSETTSEYFECIEKANVTLTALKLVDNDLFDQH